LEIAAVVSQAMDEHLTVRWGKFSLNKEENDGATLEADEIEPIIHRGKVCLIGKLMAERIVPKEYFRVPLLKIWRPVGTVSFQVVGGNIFVTEFEEEGDKIRVMEGRPWIFYGNLISLAEFDGLTSPTAISFEHAVFWVRMYNLPLACMGKAAGQKIGASVGVVEAVDVHDDDPGWGKYLRVKIRLDLSKPLSRGRMLHIQDRSIWIAFKYEKLPNYCYQCGVILHGQKCCHRDGSRRSPGTEEDQPYGPWLRVIFLSRRLPHSPGRGSLGKADGRSRKSFPTPEYYAKRRDTEEEPQGRSAATHICHKPFSRTDLANMETTGDGDGEVNGAINGDDCFLTGNGESPTNLFPLRRDTRGLNLLGDCDADTPPMKEAYKEGIKSYVGKEDRWGGPHRLTSRFSMQVWE